MKNVETYLAEAKEKVAKKYGYDSFETIDFYAVDAGEITLKPPYSEERLTNEAALLALQSQAEDAKIELSNLAYQLEIAKRQRDIAEVELTKTNKP